MLAVSKNIICVAGVEESLMEVKEVKEELRK